MFDYWITPEDYAIAEQNGIIADTLTDRVSKFGWDKKKAINTPTRPKRDLLPYRKIAQENGITEKIFNGRMRRNWNPIRAATQPIKDHKETLNERWEKDRVYPVEYVQKAEENGVSYKLFQWRVSHGWTVEDAANTKKMTTKEASSRAYSKSGWKNGPGLFAKKGLKV